MNSIGSFQIVSKYQLPRSGYGIVVLVLKILVFPVGDIHLNTRLVFRFVQYVKLLQSMYLIFD